MKTQNVRLFDVLLLGPLMIYAGTRLTQQPKDKGLGLFIAAAGAGTILYNWRNYQRAKKSPR